MLQTGTAQGALGQIMQKLALGDSAALNATGTQQQTQNQGALDLIYKNAMGDRNANMDLLTWAKSIISGVAAPSESGSSQSSSSNQQSVSSSDSSSTQAGQTNYTPSQLAQLFAAYQIMTGATPSTKTGG